MAKKTEYFRTREDGVVLNRTYSDKGMKLERDGEKFDDAIDVAELNLQYIETDEPIDAEMTELQQKAAAYDVLMGVSE